MAAFWKSLQAALIAAGIASLGTFISVLFQHLGLPSPVTPDINIVGDDPAVMAEMGRQAAVTTLQTAIPIPVIIGIVQLFISLFGGGLGDTPKK